MPTVATTNDGYVTDEPAIYTGTNHLAAGTALGGPQIGTVQHIWLKFVNPFNQGDTISQALIDLYAWDFGSNAPGPFNGFPILIRAFDEDEATVPSSYADFNSRSKTTAQVLTAAEDLEVTAVGELATVDITTICQEVADRAGFTGASFIVSIENHATTTDIVTFMSSEFGTPPQLRVSVALEGPAWSATTYRTPNSRINYRSPNRRIFHCSPNERLKS